MYCSMYSKEVAVENVAYLKLCIIGLCYFVSKAYYYRVRITIKGYNHAQTRLLEIITFTGVFL